ncbi:unnamed protein product [Rhizophagus irregularis]|nr:unnamed protein product [Rhizophagus irregularis]
MEIDENIESRIPLLDAAKVPLEESEEEDQLIPDEDGPTTIQNNIECKELNLTARKITYCKTEGFRKILWELSLDSIDKKIYEKSHIKILSKELSTLDLWMHLHRIPKVKISTLKFIMKKFQDNEFKDSVLKSGLKFYHPTIIVLMGTPISHKMECLKERLRKLHQSQAQTALIGLVLWK